MSRTSQMHQALERIVPLNGRKSLRYQQAATYTGLPLTKLEALVVSGRVKSCKVGRTRLIDRLSLERAIDALAMDEPRTVRS